MPRTLCLRPPSQQPAAQDSSPDCGLRPRPGPAGMLATRRAEGRLGRTLAWEVGPWPCHAHPRSPVPRLCRGTQHGAPGPGLFVHALLTLPEALTPVLWLRGDPVGRSQERAQGGRGAGGWAGVLRELGGAEEGLPGTQGRAGAAEERGLKQRRGRRGGGGGWGHWGPEVGQGARAGPGAAGNTPRSRPQGSAQALTCWEKPAHAFLEAAPARSGKRGALAKKAGSEQAPGGPGCGAPKDPACSLLTFAALSSAAGPVAPRGAGHGPHLRVPLPRGPVCSPRPHPSVPSRPSPPNHPGLPRASLHTQPDTPLF